MSSATPDPPASRQQMTPRPEGAPTPRSTPATTAAQGIAPASGSPARSAAPPPIIRADHLTKRIGDKTLVEDLTFEVKQGEIFGFIGPSGSGKTSTIRLLTG